MERQLLENIVRAYRDSGFDIGMMILHYASGLHGAVEEAARFLKGPERLDLWIEETMSDGRVKRACVRTCLDGEQDKIRRIYSGHKNMKLVFVPEGDPEPEVF